MIALLLVVALAGFELRQSTPRANWYVLATRPDLKVDAKKCEKFLHATEVTFGVVVPHFTYLRVKNGEEVRIYGGSHAGGIADSSRNLVVSTEACSMHELAHLVSGQISEPDMMFEEGNAAMLGRDYNRQQRNYAKSEARMRGVRYAMAESHFRRDVESTSELWYEYRLADGWVRHLVHRYGMPKLVAFFRAHGDLRNTREAFRVAYGEDIDSVFDSWLYGKNGPPTRHRARHR